MIVNNHLNSHHLRPLLGAELVKRKLEPAGGFVAKRLGSRFGLKISWDNIFLLAVLIVVLSECCGE